MTPQERKVMQMALDALELVDGYVMGKHEAKEALYEALAQPEQEPVAWMEIEKYTEGDKQFEQTLVRPYNSGRGVPLYTTPPHPWIDNKQTGNFFSVPPPQREWQGLTEEEMLEAENGCSYMDAFDLTLYANNIEAKLKEKNGAT